MVTAVTETRDIVEDAVISLVIIAKNWSPREVEGISGLLNRVFYFNENPNAFDGFDDNTQVKLNLFIQEVLDGEH